MDLRRLRNHDRQATESEEFFGVLSAIWEQVFAFGIVSPTVTLRSAVGGVRLHELVGIYDEQRRELR